MNTSTSIFKFATIRNPTDEIASQPGFEIQPETNLARSLIDIIESDKTHPEQIRLINQELDAFIQSTRFFRSKLEILETISKIKPNSNEPDASKKTAAGKEAPSKPNELYETLYDNIVVRTLTKSTTNEIFKVLTENIRTLHQQLNAKQVRVEQTKKLKIILPEGLVISFSPPKPTSTPVANEDQTALLVRLQALTEQKQRLQESKNETSSRITAEQRRISEQQMEEERTHFKQSETGQVKTTKSSGENADQAETRSGTSTVLDELEAKAAGITSSEKQINSQLTELSHQVVQLLPHVKYARIGERWVDVSRFEQTGLATVEGDAIMVHSAGCSLKFPFQVADLRVVEQQTVGYVPAEIAHINNTQQGELHEKVTRRLKRVETFESLITEDETFRETDTQSTDKFTLEKAASEVQSEESSLSVNASVSGTYGVVTASLDAGYSSSQSSQNANSASQSYAKEIVQRVVDRASNKIRKERSLKTLEEFEETVKHVIDNRTSAGPKSYVYRWLTKLSRATLKNYGKRLIFQIDIAHPSHYWISRLLKEPVLSLPPNPRGAKVFGEHIAFDITREYYLAWADIYRTNLEPPPEETIIVSYVTSGSGAQTQKELVAIPEGYKAFKAYVESNTGSGGHPPKWNYLSVLIGRTQHQRWVSGNPIVSSSINILDNETRSLPITIFTPIMEGGFSINIEIECKLEESVYVAWQVRCYHALVEAYENLKTEAENKMTEFDPGMAELLPTRRRELIRTELKKGALSKMYRCNPFWITDKYEVGKEYDPECCTDSLNAEKVRFLETLFDWNNITYELYPYLYARKDNWAGLLDLSDDDPHFEAFLQASFATVRIPVYRDSLKETAAVNFIMNNSIANYEVVPASMQSLLDELDNVQPTKFTVGLNGEDLPEPIEVVDLGIFPVPTDLVILECGVENGIKPIGFPQKEAEETDVSIPKQYSPAIIADRCSDTTVPPEDVDPVGVDLTPPDSTL